MLMRNAGPCLLHLLATPANTGKKIGKASKQGLWCPRAHLKPKELRMPPNNASDAQPRLPVTIDCLDLRQQKKHSAKPSLTKGLHATVLLGQRHFYFPQLNALTPPITCGSGLPTSHT